MGFSLHKLRDHLVQHARVNMNRPPFDWKALEKLQEIRHCIVHADGWITDDFANRLGRVGLTVKRECHSGCPRTILRTPGGL
jgi:hypothetical protein